MPDAVMIFGAGFGARMGALTKARPKPLVEVAGKPLLDHALEQAQGVPRRVVNTFYKADQIKRFLDGSDVQVSLEAPDILETGGGLRHALPLLGADPVFTLNSDAVWAGPNALHSLAAAWRPDEMDALLLLVPLTRAIGRKGGGDFALDPQGRLKRGGDLVYTGAQIVKTDGLTDIPEASFSLNILWNQMAEEKRLFGIIYAGSWADVGHPEGIALAEKMLDENDV